MEERLKYVDVKKEVYKEKFKKIEQGKISWNWCSFLVGGFWFLYRKMYSYFFAILGVTTVIGIILNFITKDMTGKTGSVIEFVVNIILMVIMGLIGDRLYYHRIERVMSMTNNEEEKWRNIERYGGVSKKAVVIGIVIYLLVFITILVLAVSSLIAVGGF